MIDITEIAPRALEMKVRGSIEQSDLEKLETVLGPYLPDEGTISAVIDLSEAEETAPLVDNTSHAERLLSQFDKFARIAVVSQKIAKDSVVRAVEMLMPAGSLRRFAPVQAAKAREFAAYPGQNETRAHPAE